MLQWRVVFHSVVLFSAVSFLSWLEFIGSRHDCIVFSLNANTLTSNCSSTGSILALACGRWPCGVWLTGQFPLVHLLVHKGHTNKKRGKSKMVLYTIALKNTFAFTPRFMPRIENTYRTVLRGETKWFYLFSYLISLTTRLVSPLDLCRWLNTKKRCKYILYEIRKLLQVSVRPLKAILI